MKSPIASIRTCEIGLARDPAAFQPVDGLNELKPITAKITKYTATFGRIASIISTEIVLRGKANPRLRL
ncbi:hypothetical protein D3C86_1732040 [compost metagenome]